MHEVVRGINSSLDSSFQEGSMEKKDRNFKASLLCCPCQEVFTGYYCFSSPGACNFVPCILLSDLL